MQQSYAAICLISTRKVPRHGLDFRVTASLKSQCLCVTQRGVEMVRVPLLVREVWLHARVSPGPSVIELSNVHSSSWV